MKGLTLAVVALLAGASHVAAQTWTPPVGIPAPPFGVSQVTPAAGVPLTAWPATMQPGSIAQLSGTITGGTLTCNGTATTPCWILGGTATLTGDFTVLGSYTILDGLHFSGVHSLGLGGSHNVVRNSSSVGTNGDPTGAAFYDFGSYNVVWRNRVTDHGDVHGTADQDSHGISVVRSADHAFVLENETARNAGDGINVNSYPYDQAGFSAIRFVYIGRNVSHDNKQTAFWAKQSQDVVFSQNEGYGEGVDPQGFSYGQCAGFQYSTERVWFIANNFHDCAVGIGVSSDDVSPAPATHAFFLANRLSNVGVSDPTFCGTGGPWTCSAIRLTNAGTDYVLDNVFANLLNDALHATAGSLVSNVTGAVVSEDVALTGMTRAQVNASFLATYGLDISSGTVPGNGTVGPGALAPVPSSTPTPTLAPKPTPTPAPIKPVLPKCGPGLSGFLNWLLGKCA